MNHEKRSIGNHESHENTRKEDHNHNQTETWGLEVFRAISVSVVNTALQKIGATKVTKIHEIEHC